MGALEYLLVELPLRSLFETPTVAELTLTIEEMPLERIEHIAKDDVEYRMEGQDVR